jgi:hypothetical protein
MRTILGVNACVLALLQKADYALIGVKRVSMRMGCILKRHYITLCP